MCGIVGYIGDRDSATVLLDGLEKLEYRGYDSAGIAVFVGDNIEVVKAKGRLKNIEELMERTHRPEGHCGIGHTRWATHGEPSDINSHPHSSKRISIVHNGIIENYVELRDFLISKGYDFVSETDTETVVKLLDYYYDGDPVAAIQQAIKVVRGSYALGILFKDFPDKLYAVRKDSPLIVGLGEHENFIASDIPAVLKYTKNYYLLNDNDIVILEKEKVTVLDEFGTVQHKQVQTATWDLEAAEKGGFPHFMLKEINEQPKAIKDTLSPRIKQGEINFEVDSLSEKALLQFQNIRIVGCGTAMHAGMVGKQVIEKLARIPVEVDIASEFRYKDPILTKDDLLIIISQSGETADTLAALRLAKKRGVHTLAVVNVVGSSIAREADSVVYTWAGPEISVASTKAYSVQLAAMYLIAIKLAHAHRTIDDETYRQYTEKLMEIPDFVASILKKSDECKHYAALFVNAKDLFFLGRGLDYALAMEGSLKLKEISYIHSEAYAAGELKHGTISLITDDVPVVALVTQQNLAEKTISNIKETKARGAKVLVFTDLEDELFSDCADYIIHLPRTDDLFMPLLAVVPLQLFAYYSSVLRGCDVDKPRNLAKSVTVE